MATHAEGLLESTPSAVAVRAGRDLLYLIIGLATSIVGFALWVTAVSLTLSLLILIIGLPVFLLSAYAFRLVVELDRRNAALVLGRPLRGRYADKRGQGFFGLLSKTASDPQTWRDLSWLVTHSIVGFVFGIVAITLVAQAIGAATLPLWAWAIPEGVDWGFWRIDTVWEALAAMPLALPLAAIAVVLMRGMALLQARLAAALLGPLEGAAEPASRSGVPPVDRRAAEYLGLAFAALVGVTVTLIWSLTGQGYFWPAWVWLGVGIPVAYGAALELAARAPAGRLRGLATHSAISAVTGAILVVVWALAGGGQLWPIWPLLGLGVLLGAHGALVALWPHRREQELVERVDELTRTRRGALDVQAAELRRIERDLHDGAQARLVALSMQLGRAEAKLADQPELAELVRQARGEAGAAIAELRDLARGIAPPVLAARGLQAAVEALGTRVPASVTVDAVLERRPPPVIEAAAYFVVAESLTNVAKHAAGASARVLIRLRGEVLTIEVADDGPGGANRAGNGLTGLRHRVEALDGVLRVTSPPGHGTTIRAELPCES